MKRMKLLLVVCATTFVFTACGEVKNSVFTQKNGDMEQNEIIHTKESNENHETITIKKSLDKYTWYIKDYVGKNVASFGYTSIDGNRMDRYGDGLIKIIFVKNDGSYIDIENEEELKNYVVVEQNIKPNTEMKYVFQKDEEGKEYDGLIESQTFEEIVLAVKEVGSSSENAIELTEMNASLDKYTWYVRDYAGRNLATCGYLSMGGNLRDTYGATNIVFVITIDDGSYIDVSDLETLKKYRVTGQNISPNTEMKLEFLKDENGEEYENLVDSQSIEEIELYVSLIEK